MGLKNLFSFRKKSIPTQSVSQQIYTAIQGAVYTERALSEREALEFYRDISPVASAINLIADGFKDLDIVLWDGKSEEYIKSLSEGISTEQISFFKMLSKPNPIQSQSEFLKELCVNYEATGNAYIIATGNIDGEISELYLPSPTGVDIQMVVNDPLPALYRISLANGTQEAFARRLTKYGLRFVNQSGTRELYHFHNINPDKNSVRGLSPLAEIKKEIEQYKEANLHNLALLKNGAYLGGILGIPNLTKEQQDALRDDFNSRFTGSQNAKRTAIVNKDFDYKELGQNSADIQFRDLRNDNRKIIYNAFKIPLPIVSEDASTFNNYAEATLKLYDNCIFPAANYLLSGLTGFILPRFGLQDLQIWFDENEITALDDRRAKNFERLKGTGILTINELRAELGRQPYAGEADTLYQSNTLLPVGYIAPQPMQLSAPTKSKFTAIMRQQLWPDGKRKFTDEEIEMFAKKEGLKDV